MMNEVKTVAVLGEAGKIELVTAIISSPNFAHIDGERFKAHSTITFNGQRYDFYAPAPKSTKHGNCVRCAGSGTYGNHGVCYDCGGTGNRAKVTG